MRQGCGTRLCKAPDIPWFWFRPHPAYDRVPICRLQKSTERQSEAIRYEPLMREVYPNATPGRSGKASAEKQWPGVRWVVSAKAFSIALGVNTTRHMKRRNSKQRYVSLLRANIAHASSAVRPVMNGVTQIFADHLKVSHSRPAGEQRQCVIHSHSWHTVAGAPATWRPIATYIHRRSHGGKGAMPTSNFWHILSFCALRSGIPNKCCCSLTFGHPKNFGLATPLPSHQHFTSADPVSCNRGEKRTIEFYVLC